MDFIVDRGTAAAEVVPLSLARLQSRILARPDGTHPEDAFVSHLIAAATEWAEGFTRQDIRQRAVTIRAQKFFGYLVLPVRPVRSVTSVEYLDVAGQWQPLQFSEPTPGAVLVEPDDMPTDVGDYPYPFRISCEAGFETVPSSIVAAILLMVGHWYEHREGVSDLPLSEVPMGARDLLWPHRILTIGD